MNTCIITKHVLQNNSRKKSNHIFGIIEKWEQWDSWDFRDLLDLREFGTSGTRTPSTSRSHGPLGLPGPLEQSKRKFAFTFKVILFIELLTMVIRGLDSLLFPSSYVTVINRNDSQWHLIGFTWIEKISQFITLR